MTTPFHRPPAPSGEWRECQPFYLSTYNIVLDAERHAVQQVEANPLEAKNNVVSATMTGYLLEA